MCLSLYVEKEVFLLTLLSTIAICLFSVPISNAQYKGETSLQKTNAIAPLLGNSKRLLQASAVYSENLKINRNFSPSAVELDDSFNVSLDFLAGEIKVSTKQADGKLLVGGFFKTLNNNRHKSLARLNADNSLDSSFAPEVNGTVFAITVQADGKILIGGSFTAVNGTNQVKIARLNSDGSIDKTFDVGNGADNDVLDIAIQTDGKIIISGAFNGIDGNLSPIVGRLNVDGSFDNSLTSPLPPQPTDLPQSPTLFAKGVALQTDEKIVLGGSFDFNLNVPNDGERQLIRLNTDGTVDNTFTVLDINDSLTDVEVYPNDKILISGFFNSINGNEDLYIVRLNSDGSLDISFDAPFAPPTTDIFIGDGGKILASRFLSRPTNLAVQLNNVGSLDSIYRSNQDVTGELHTVNQVANGKVFVGGDYVTTDGTPNTAMLFNTNGSVDTSFVLNSTALGGIRAMVTQPDGKVVIAGNFNRADGNSRDKLTRLNVDGTIDESFAANEISAIEISSLLLQPDGKIILGGIGITEGSFISGSILRLNADGTFDSSFTEWSLSVVDVKSMALQSDGKIILSYTFSLFGSMPGGDITRLNANGSVDNSFDSGVPLSFEAIAIQPNGKILVGGLSTFSYVNSGTGSDTYYNVFLLNEDGSHNRDFRAALLPEDGFSNNVFDLKLQDDGKILVGGSLSVQGVMSKIGVVRLQPNGAIDNTFQLNPISSLTEFARIEDIKIQPDGKLLTGGRFDNLGASNSTNIARLNANGSADTSLNATTDNAIFDVELQNNEDILIGGDFENVNGVGRTSLARLLNAQPNRNTKFDFDGDGKTDVSIFRPNVGQWWYLRSSDFGNAAFAFGTNTDKLVPADYTGDGKTDIAFWRESTGEWFVLRSEDFSFYSVPFGTSGDIPAPGDFDGDGIADTAVYRPSETTWYIQRSSDGGTTIQQFGVAEDKPTVADFDGDGKDDIAIFRPSVSQWWQLRSQDGVIAYQFGASGDKTVQGDYTGDGKADVGVFRPSTGQWLILRSEDSSFFGFPFGISTDSPSPGDYDGDGKFDAAVFRPSTNTWFYNGSASGNVQLNFGITGDIPLPNVYSVE